MLIGHSYGGDTAYHVSKILNKKGCPHILLTIDPVSRFQLDTRFSTPHPGQGVEWINVVAESGTLDTINRTPLLGELTSLGTFIIGGAGTILTAGQVDYFIAELMAGSPGGRWSERDEANANFMNTVNHGDIKGMMKSDDTEAKINSRINKYGHNINIESNFDSGKKWKYRSH